MEGANRMTILRGTSTLLEGGPGSGKTHALTTFMEAGVELVVAITDPGGQETLLKVVREKNLPLDMLHYSYISPANPPWQTLKAMAQRINDFSYKDLAEMKTGIEKKAYQQYYELLSTLSDFKCQHCGAQLGAADTWGPEKALALDSLTGLNIMAFQMMVGAKPAAHQGEWGVAMNAEEQLINKCVSDLKCFFVLTAHVEKEPDILTGVPTITAGALGRKIAPKLGRGFSDVILAKRIEKEFVWSTIEGGADLKARNIPLSGTLQPTFVQIVDRWRELNKYSQQQPEQQEVTA